MSRGAPPLCERERSRRMAVANEVAAEGANLTTFARRAGLKIPTARKFLLRYAPSEHKQLASGPRGSPISAHAALVRLLLMKSVEGLPGGEVRLAKALGLNPQTIYVFRRKWAPDGLDAAIADLMPEDHPGECQLKTQPKCSFTRQVHEATHG